MRGPNQMKSVWCPPPPLQYSCWEAASWSLHHKQIVNGIKIGFVCKLTFLVKSEVIRIIYNYYDRKGGNKFNTKIWRLAKIWNTTKTGRSTLLWYQWIISHPCMHIHVSLLFINYMRALFNNYCVRKLITSSYNNIVLFFFLMAEVM